MTESTDNEASLLEEWSSLEAARSRGVLVIVTSTQGHCPQVAGAKMLVREDGSFRGTVGGGRLEHEAIEFARSLLAEPAQPQQRTWHLLHDLGMCCGGQMNLYFEPNRLRPRLTIFGAGHVAMPTARLARQIGFHVTVVDDREDWNTSVRFPLADERKLTAYTDYLASQPMDPGEYALVVTQGHDHDEEIVRELSRVPLAYLGMIGSTRKVERTRRRLPPSEEWSVPLHAPVGLSIGAETPEEIAVSIAAELIQVRRSNPSSETKE